MALNWSSTASCLHHRARIRPLTAYPVSYCAQNSNIGRRSTHCDTVTWCLSMYDCMSYVPTAFNTPSDPYHHQFPSSRLFDHFPITSRQNPVWTPTILFSIASDKTHVSAPQKITTCTTALKNAADVIRSAPSHLNMTHILPHTCRALPMFRMTSDHSSSECSSSRPRHLKSATTLIVSSPSFPVKLNSISTHQLVNSTPLRLIRISVFLKQHAVLRCLSSRPAGMYILHMSQQGSAPPPPPAAPRPSSENFCT